MRGLPQRERKIWEIPVGVRASPSHTIHRISGCYGGELRRKFNSSLKHFFLQFFQKERKFDFMPRFKIPYCCVSGFMMAESDVCWARAWVSGGGGGHAVQVAPLTGLCGGCSSGGPAASLTVLTRCSLAAEPDPDPDSSRRRSTISSCVSANRDNTCKHGTVTP